MTLSDKKFTPQSGYKTYDPSSLLDAKFGNENKDPMNVYYDYLAGDTYKEKPLSYDQLSVLKYDDVSDLSIWGAPEYNGKITDIGGDHGNVLDYRFTDPVQTYIDTRDGEMRFFVPTSFTFQFDICYTGNEDIEKIESIEIEKRPENAKMLLYEIQSNVQQLEAKKEILISSNMTMNEVQFCLEELQIWIWFIQRSVWNSP